MILGVDPGERRVGVAAANPETRFAHPVEVIDVQVSDPFQRIASLAEQMGATCIVVGRPVGLSGRAGPAVKVQSEFVSGLRAATTVAVVEYDERLTTVVADRSLKSSGARAARVKELRDAIAAQVMLQGYLDAGR